MMMMMTSHVCLHRLTNILRFFGPSVADNFIYAFVLIE